METGVRHVGQGGLVWYVLREVHWYSFSWSEKSDVIGLSQYYHKFRHWDETRERFEQSALKQDTGMRMA